MESGKNKTVVVIAGPTAVGKTAVAIELAKEFGTEIISADSRQCFRELKIGVARPSLEELASVKHHFIASHSIQDEVTAAGFEHYALEKTNELFRNNDNVVMVGGTGLYIKAFCEGLDQVPAVDPATREAITTNYKEKGIGWLQEELKQKDPEFFAKGEMKNPQRMMRALEVVEQTGSSIMSFRNQEKKGRDFKLIRIGLELPREELEARIKKRTTQMIEAGLVKEVRALNSWRHLNALQTVGYTELFEFLDGHCTLEAAVEQIWINTRQYAKRQMTWFKKDKMIKWFSPGETDQIKGYIRENR